jgi:Zn-dependent peptidase ImmA (M78 family)
MERVRVAGRTYTDPDVISLIKQTGDLVDPRSAVLTQARKLVDEFQQFAGTIPDPLERVKVLASMRGIKVVPMDVERQRSERRDAVLVPTASGQMALYNPRLPNSRIAFTIAHEIVHTFFPNSPKGTRFRHIVADGSKEAYELEGLCHLGAAEILMPLGQFQKAMGRVPSIQSVDRLSALFGSSFEATVIRLATAHHGIAMAGLLQYRCTRAEERQMRGAKQQDLFANAQRLLSHAPTPKYRRQSLHTSEAAYGNEHFIPWNKSFSPDSVAYRAGSDGTLCMGTEALPNGSGKQGRLEAVAAPYQRNTADEKYPDVLFLWQEIEHQ